MKTQSVAAIVVQSQDSDKQVNEVLKNHGKVSTDTFEKVAGKPGVSNGGLLDTIGTLATGEGILTTSR